MATNEKFAEPVLSVVCSHPATPQTGQPVRFGGLTGVALTDEAEGGNATGYTTVDFREKVWDLSVEGTDEDGNSAVAVGDALFYADADGATLSKDPTGYFFGWALETVDSAGTDTIMVLKAGAGAVPEAVASVELAEMADLTRGSVIVGGASGRPTALVAKADAQILVGDGTDLASVAVSGDATIDNTGAVSLADDCVDSAEIADGAVDPVHLAGGFLGVALIAGGSAGDHTVTGIASGDEIVFVGHISTAADIATMADLTSEFSVGGADTINNAAGTDTTNDQLFVFYLDLT